MAVTVESNESDTTPSALELSLSAMQAAARERSAPTYAQRMDRLKRLDAVISCYGVELAEALVADYGNRSLTQTIGAEALTVSGQIRHTRRRLRLWIRPRAKFVGPIHMMGATAVLRPEPLGVVGIMSPWNFPVALTMAPLISALAAGNRAMCKISEYTPNTAEVLRGACAEWFDPTEVEIITGDAAISRDFAALPFDHLFFTGSTAVGRHIMRAAADNLTPVTLELGGKSPFVVGPDARMDRVAKVVMSGKTFNAGQYCVAPDRVFVPEARVDEFINACRAAGKSMLEAAGTTSIVNDMHFERIRRLRNDAIEQGATEELLISEMEAFDDEDRIIAPAALLNTSASMAVMEEEIFGPLFTLHPYRSVKQTITEINAGPEPLAAYYFGPNSEARKLFIDRVTAGGILVNDIMVHVGLESLPFGGVGDSGTGVYHGKAGFDTFSHLKPVVKLFGPVTPGATTPPYPAITEKMLGQTLDFRSRPANRMRRKRETQAPGYSARNQQP